MKKKISEGLQKTSHQAIGLLIVWLISCVMSTHFLLERHALYLDSHLL